jgi:hypothetical protein
MDKWYLVAIPIIIIFGINFLLKAKKIKNYNRLWAILDEDRIEIDARISMGLLKVVQRNASRLVYRMLAGHKYIFIPCKLLKQELEWCNEVEEQLLMNNLSAENREILKRIIANEVLRDMPSVLY